MDTSLSNHCRLDNGDANPHSVADPALSHATQAVNDSPLKVNSDSSTAKDPSQKSEDKSKSHKHHHHHHHHHHRDDKKDKHHDKSKGDRPKDKHRDHHEKNHDKSKDRHKDKEKSKDEKSKSDRPKDKHSKDDKHRSEKHDALKNVLNSPSSKPKDHHSSPSSQKLKENSHLNSSKDSSKHKDGLSSPKPKDEARLKEKIVNNHHSSSSSSHKTKVPNSTSGSSSSHSHVNKDKTKEMSKSDRSEKSDKHEKSDKSERSDGKHRSKDGSSSHKPKVVDGEEKKIHKSDKDKESHKTDKDRDSHKSDKDKEKRKEHDKHKDEKRKEERKHKEKENRDKSKENISKDKVQDHKTIKIKMEDERPPTPDIKREPEEPAHIKLKVEKSWECFDGIKQEPPASDDEEDIPLRSHSKHSKSHREHGEKAARAINLPKKEPKDIKKKENKRVAEDDSEDEPLSARITKAKKLKTAPEKRKRKMDDSDDEPAFKKKKKNLQNKKVQQNSTPTSSPTKKRTKKEEEAQNVWKWWEEEKLDEGVKWKFLEHKGPVFAPDYEPIPKSVKFYYDGKELLLSPTAEEVATFYARMLDHDYTTKEVFNKNFFKDWRKVMTKEEKELITDLKKCNFTKMASYFAQKSEERKAMTKEEKAGLRKQNEEMTKIYGFCNIDGHVEKIGNFKIEPPGLFRGRGDHPKMGMLKLRTMPENVIINCSKDSKIPEPPSGRKWKQVRHDNTVTWLACWTESVQGQTKYVMLNASSKLKGEKDWQKYETARKLKTCVGKIRDQYQLDWKSKEMRVRQRAVALYFIDKLALRAGNEKEEGETADTVGCCSLRVEHIKLHESNDKYVVDFDFLGKDSIRYQNSVNVEKRVFKNLQLFMDNKQPEDDLFDRLNTTILNKHLNELMEGLTAKVFRTFNASKTLQEQLDKLTNSDDPIAAKLLSYNRANRAVAILCNHQRAVPKTFSKSMENLQNKITAKREQVEEVEHELKDLKRNKHRTGEVVEKKKKALERLKEQMNKLEVQATDKEENKDIALGTSKLNYLDPRITVAWCKKFEVPIEKVYNRTQRDKFRWAIDMAGPDYEF